MQVLVVGRQRYCRNVNGAILIIPDVDSVPNDAPYRFDYRGDIL